MPNIPNFTIGTKLDDVKNYIYSHSQTNKLNQKAVQCLFNFIEDDKSIGDGKITNSIELTMINGFLANAKNPLIPDFLKKILIIPMPEPIQLDDEKVVDYWTNDNNCGEITKSVNNNLKETSYHSPTYTQYYANTGNNSDYMEDKNNDGIADSRWVNIQKENGDKKLRIRYRDNDLDGTFEEKHVLIETRDNKSEGVHAKYIKDSGGHWRQVDVYKLPH